MRQSLLLLCLLALPFSNALITGRGDQDNPIHPEHSSFFPPRVPQLPSFLQKSKALPKRATTTPTYNRKNAAAAIARKKKLATAAASRASQRLAVANKKAAALKAEEAATKARNDLLAAAAAASATAEAAALMSEIAQAAATAASRPTATGKGNRPKGKAKVTVGQTGFTNDKLGIITFHRCASTLNCIMDIMTVPNSVPACLQNACNFLCATGFDPSGGSCIKSAPTCGTSGAPCPSINNGYNVCNSAGQCIPTCKEGVGLFLHTMATTGIQSCIDPHNDALACGKTYEVCPVSYDGIGTPKCRMGACTLACPLGRFPHARGDGLMGCS